MNTVWRKTAAYILSVLMTASAILHVYWALGGTWFLSTALGMDLETIPASLLVITWIFVAGMLLAATMFLGRAEIVSLPLPQSWLAVGAWLFASLMFLGALFNFSIPRFWDRWVFAPVFLVLALLSLILALPMKRTNE